MSGWSLQLKTYLMVRRAYCSNLCLRVWQNIIPQSLHKKVTRGLTENALKCKFNGGTIPIGYVINKERLFEIDPLKAPWVLEAFKWYNNGKTIKQIVNLLNEKGVTTSLGSKITINIVTNLLKNRRYIGEHRFRDIVHEDGIPPIVSHSSFPNTFGSDKARWRWPRG